MSIAVGIAAATVLAFVISFVFYSVVPTGEPAPDDAAAPGPAKIALELLRSAATASLVAGLLVAAGWSGAGTGARLGLALTVLPAVLLSGSVLWEDVPVRRAATHLGDWILKLLAVGAVVGAFT